MAPTAELQSLPMIRSPFPLAGHRPVLSLGRPLADHRHVPDLLVVVATAAGRRLAPGAHPAGQLPAQGRQRVTALSGLHP
jgi:hypothetical protein